MLDRAKLVGIIESDRRTVQRSATLAAYDMMLHYLQAAAQPVGIDIVARAVDQPVSDERDERAGGFVSDESTARADFGAGFEKDARADNRVSTVFVALDSVEPTCPECARRRAVKAAAQRRWRRGKGSA